MDTTIVIVFYKQKIETSTTFKSLVKLFAKNEINKQFEIILYDNSPEPQSYDIQDFPFAKVSYVHDKRNLGIAVAYNYAYNIAVNNESDWLLLLDHDTELNDDYFNKIVNLPEFNDKIGAVVPMVKTREQRISPVYSASLRPLVGEMPQPGLQTQHIMAINSGALISVDFLKKIDGFNEEFPLDYLDHWLFYEIYRNDYNVYVLDTTLQHELSVMDYNSISLDRYKSILNSEVKFYRDYKTDLFPEFRKQLLKRILKQLLLVKNKKIALYSIKVLRSLKG